MDCSITLASSSIYRRRILQRLGLNFSVASPDIDESVIVGESARQLVERLSLAKASAIASKLEHGLIIGSDQVSVQNGEIIGKPANHADAVRQLQAASGNSATLYSGVALVNAASGKMQSTVVEVQVVCRTLTDSEIQRYLVVDKPYNCCGSLKVEGLGIALLESISSSDPNAITGMPVIELLKMLRAEGLVVP